MPHLASTRLNNLYPQPQKNLWNPAYSYQSYTKQQFSSWTSITQPTLHIPNQICQNACILAQLSLNTTITHRQSTQSRTCFVSTNLIHLFTNSPCRNPHTVFPLPSHLHPAQLKPCNIILYYPTLRLRLKNMEHIKTLPHLMKTEDVQLSSKYIFTWRWQGC